MKQCPKCDGGTIQEATRICRENDYSIVNDEGNVLKKLSDHDLSSNDGEVGDSTQVIYCSCGLWWGA